jgi:hypothetical protein
LLEEFISEVWVTVSSWTQIFEKLIKVAKSNAISWDKMKLVKEKAKDIEQSYND